MIFYFDTSVIFPALLKEHPLHNDAALALYNCLQAGSVACVTNHLYAELYANLTRYPLAGKLAPDKAYDLIVNRLSPLVTTISLDQEDYKQALARCARNNILSGGVFDALHVQAAVKINAGYIYTNNISDFKRLTEETDLFQLKDTTPPSVP